MAQHAGYQPCRCVDQHHRGQLAAAQHIVANRPLFIDVTLHHTLVDTFVAPGNHHQRACRGERLHALLIQPTPLGRQVDHRWRQAGGLLGTLARIKDSRSERIYLHQHTGAAAIGAIVHAAVAVGGIITRIPELKGNALLLYRSTDHTLQGYRIEHVGKQRYHANPHRRHVCRVLFEHRWIVR